MLLFGGFVSDIHINDIDPGIWSFWNSVLNENDALVDLVLGTPVTVEEWYRQREILQLGEEAGPLKVGFATFFLNRTNRSGIIKGAGVIGGLGQTGAYKIDCRFNREDLVRRIRRIGRYADQIHLSRLDALDFLDHVEEDLPESTFCCIDPPYFNKGASLYTSFYEPSDHALVANRVLKLSCPWVLTYDDADEIRALYASRRQFEFNAQYSVRTKRVGREVLIPSDDLRMEVGLNRMPLADQPALSVSLA